MNEANGDNFTYIRNTDVSFICRQVVEKENGLLLLRDAMSIPREHWVGGYKILDDPSMFNKRANCRLLSFSGAEPRSYTEIEIIADAYVNALLEGSYEGLSICDVEVGTNTITQKFACPEFTRFYNQFHDAAVRKHELALKQLNATKP